MLNNGLETVSKDTPSVRGTDEEHEICEDSRCLDRDLKPEHPKCEVFTLFFLFSGKAGYATDSGATGLLWFGRNFKPTPPNIS
jgi:hypothetical protein